MLLLTHRGECVVDQGFVDTQRALTVLVAKTGNDFLKWLFHSVIIFLREEKQQKSL